MTPAKSLRKRQTRLSFTPLPSSSPAAKDYNKQIRDRAAAVTLQDSPAKRRKTRHADADSDLDILDTVDRSAIIMPEASSIEREKEAGNELDDSDQLPARLVRRRSNKSHQKTCKRQPRLDFTTLRDPDFFDPPVKLPSLSACPASSAKAGMFSSQAQRRVFDLSSNDSDDLPSVEKLLMKSKKARTGNDREPNRATRSSRMPATEADEESDEMAVKRSVPQQVHDERSDDEDDILVSTQRHRQRRTGRSSPPASVESEDDNDMPTTLGTQRRGRFQRRTSRSSFIDDSPPELVESDDDVITVAEPSKKRRRQETENEEEEEEEDDDDVVAPKTPSRRLKKSRHLTEQEKEDLAEDLDFFKPSSDDDSANDNPRTTQSAKKSARQKALDKLKRIRSSQQRPDDKEAEQREVVADEQDEQDDDEEEEEEEVAEYTSSRRMFRQDADDEDFIEKEEADGMLGVLEDMPIEFTRHASSKPKDLFKHAVEWMVSKLINPAFRSEDSLYRLAFQKLDDEVRGLAGSKFTSSAWTSEFTIALEARPDFSFTRIDRNSAEHAYRDKCDACNRSNHPPTWEIQFRDRPYNRDTLEDYDEEQDDDDDENSGLNSSASQEAANKDNQPEWDAQGREILPANTSFYVGKFCKANAETAHTLRHWRRHLYDYVETTMRARGYFDPDELVKRQPWNTQKRQKYANKIVDRMQSEGTIKELWSLFREKIETARTSKQGRYAADSP